MLKMIESKFERELSLLMKCMNINYNSELINGEDAFRKLIIDVDVLGKDYIINWEDVPISINVL